MKKIKSLLAIFLSLPHLVLAAPKIQPDTTRNISLSAIEVVVLLAIAFWIYKILSKKSTKETHRVKLLKLLGAIALLLLVLGAIVATQVFTPYSQFQQSR